MTIEEINSPLDLTEMFLIADPNEEKVKEYLSSGRVFVLKDSEIIGGYVLIEKETTLELINIVVKEAHQNQGYGKTLLEHVIEISKLTGASTLELGTGNSSLTQLYLYQKVGFRITGIEKDFFIKHYEEPIFENGLQCLDMIRLSIDLKGVNQ